MRILVIGGAGYIGSHTVKRLLARGHQVTVFDNLSAGHRAAVPAERIVVGDLRDTAHLDQTLLEAVVHFAASTYVGESVTDPAKYYTNNLVHFLGLLDRVRKLGVQKFVFSSTCATYGSPQTVPITSSDGIPPLAVTPLSPSTRPASSPVRPDRPA